MARVYLDTCIIIYLHEGPPALRRSLSERILPAGGPAPVIHVSDLTRMECRVGPLKAGDDALLIEYERFFGLPEVEWVPLLRATFDRATELRARHGLKTPDALHLAAALSAGCDEFWTNDKQLAAAAGPLKLEIVK